MKHRSMSHNATKPASRGVRPPVKKRETLTIDPGDAGWNALERGEEMGYVPTYIIRGLLKASLDDGARLLNVVVQRLRDAGIPPKPDPDSLLIRVST